MIVPKAKLLAISAALLTPQLAFAQVTSRIEAGALITDANGQSPVPTSIWRIAPTGGFAGSHGSVTASGAAWLENQNWQLVDGSIGGTLVAQTIYGVRAELIGNANRAFDDRSLGADQLDMQTRINVQFNARSGAWLGGGVARPWRVMVVSSVDLLNAGAWIDVGSATLTPAATRFSLPKIADDAAGGAVGLCPTTGTLGLSSAAAPYPAPSASCQRRSHVIDATVAGRWNLDRFELAGEAGHRRGQGADGLRGYRD